MVRLMTRPLTWLALLCLPAVVSAKAGFGGECSQADTHLASDTWQLVTDCDPTTWCADNGTCAYKGCRKDTYPFGYNDVGFADLPPLCPVGQFCPDEGSACLNQIPSGGQCQRDRDDECEPAPNWKALAGYLNVNGSICLNYVCYFANVTLGQTCVTENTAYTAYTDAGAAYAFIVSRDNCENGVYCDGGSLQCVKVKSYGAACTGNKECLSYNCGYDGKCGMPADEPITPGAWVYAVIGVCIFLVISGVMVSLWFFHRRARKENQVRLEQYYNEQIAYRQSIMSMSMAKNSLLSLPPDTDPDVARRSLLGDDALGYTSATDRGGSLPPNMRRDSSFAFSDTADSEEYLMHQNRGQGQRYKEPSGGKRMQLLS